MKNSYIRTDATSTVYAIELQGINLALTIATAEVNASAFKRHINIFANN